MSLGAPVDPGDHIGGVLDASATLVLYGDYECPYTRSMHSVLRWLLRDEISAFRYVFRHFPLAAIHPHALAAARIAEAAARVGRFWAMHDTLFTNQQDLSDGALASYAGAVGLGAGAIVAALVDGLYDCRIARDVESGLASGVRGTPTIFLGERLYDGPRDAAALRMAIRAARWP